MGQGNLFDQPALPSVRLSRPPALQLVASVSVSLPARQLIATLRDAGIQALVDTRLAPSYRGQGVQTRQDDLQFVLEQAGITYLHIAQLSPTREMRDRLDQDKKDPTSWIRFLREYGELMQARRPLRTGQFAQEIIRGTFHRVAIACACQHHGDCHRQYAVGMTATWVDGVQMEHLYPVGYKPNRKSPRRYLLENIPEAGLLADEPPRSRRRRG